jgi:hypothetical protein
MQTCSTRSRTTKSRQNLPTARVAFYSRNFSYGVMLMPNNSPSLHSWPSITRM